MKKQNLAAGAAVSLAALGAAAAMAFASSATPGVTAMPAGKVLTSSARFVEVVADNRFAVGPAGAATTVVAHGNPSSPSGSTSTNTGW